MSFLATPTAFIFFVAPLVLLINSSSIYRSLVMLLVPLIAIAQIWFLGLGNFSQFGVFGFDLELMRVDKLSRVFGIIFCIAAFLGNVYAWHVKDLVQQIATLLYTGAAIGAVFAGELVSLFFYWEGTAIASVFLIWARRTEASYHTGVRYLLIQVGSGVILLAGLAIQYHETNSIAFEHIELVSFSAWLIFLSFGIKCAFPLLHNWLQDSYPAATVTGTVILSSFTTKLAVYALARSFAGTEILIYLGAVMTLFPIFFAEIENDLRRVLAYSLNNQLGFMVVAVGIGTELAINGAVAHAFAHIIYKGLLFMSMGAVLYRVGTCKASELGGLFKYMPLTAICSIVGAVSISAFPLFSGFVAKSLIMSSLGYEGLTIIYFMLLFASAGVLHHSGIKIPFFAFFAHNSNHKPKEAPLNMLIAMILSAILCILIGIFPSLFYQILPYNVYYQPYDFSHVLSQLQLLMFAVLAFICLWHFKIYPPELNSTVLNSDWFYRVFFVKVVQITIRLFLTIWNNISISFQKFFKFVFTYFKDQSFNAQKSPVTIGYSTVLILFSLAFVIICNYLLF